VAEQFDGPVGVNGGLQVSGGAVFKGPAIFEIGARSLGFFTADGMKVDGTLKTDRLETTRFVAGMPSEPVGQFAGHVGVEGNLDVAGDISLVGGDCAEDFDVAADCEDVIEPGVVVVLGPEGSLRYSTRAYDKRVAGVVAGAGGLRPGIILDRRRDRSRRLPVALVGKVSCKLDADYGGVDVGDLLTTSDTPGHAMRASDPSRAFGAVLGKALGSLRSGRAMIPVLVCLQ
jgi:hypothetical protein